MAVQNLVRACRFSGWAVTPVSPLLTLSQVTACIQAMGAATSRLPAAVPIPAKDRFLRPVGLRSEE
jgi:hypothetical protein